MCREKKCCVTFCIFASKYDFENQNLNLSFFVSHSQNHVCQTRDWDNCWSLKTKWLLTWWQTKLKYLSMMILFNQALCIKVKTFFVDIDIENLIKLSNDTISTSLKYLNFKVNNFYMLHEMMIKRCNNCLICESINRWNIIHKDTYVFLFFKFTINAIIISFVLLSTNEFDFFDEFLNLWKLNSIEFERFEIVFSTTSNWILICFFKCLIFSLIVLFVMRDLFSNVLNIEFFAMKVCINSHIVK